MIFHFWMIYLIYHVTFSYFNKFWPTFLWALYNFLPIFKVLFKFIFLLFFCTYDLFLLFNLYSLLFLRKHLSLVKYLGSSFKWQNWQLAYLNIKPEIFLFLSYRWISLFCRVECYNEKWIFKGLFPLPFDVIAIILLGLRHRATKMFRSLRWVRKTWVPKIGHY